MATPDLTGLKRFLDLDNNAAYDQELQTYLAAAKTTIGQRTGPVESKSVTEQQRATCGVLLVNQWPVIAVTSATDDDGAAIDVSGVKIDKGAGIIRLGVDLTELVEITYTAGHVPCPDDLELATYVVGGHLWDTQRGRSGSFSQIHGLDDDSPVGAEASQFVLQGFALPRRAMELTRPYVKAGFR